MRNMRARKAHWTILRMETATRQENDMCMLLRLSEPLLDYVSIDEIPVMKFFSSSFALDMNGKFSFPFMVSS